jgi:hypothetical protein
VLGVLPDQPVVHLDAGYDYQDCRQVLAERAMVGQIATRPVVDRAGQTGCVPGPGRVLTWPGTGAAPQPAQLRCWWTRPPQPSCW